MAARKKAQKKEEAEKKAKQKAKNKERSKTPAAKIRRSNQDATALFVAKTCQKVSQLKTLATKAVKKVFEGKVRKQKLEKISNAMNRKNPGLTRMALGNMLRHAVKKGVEAGLAKTEDKFLAKL